MGSSLVQVKPETRGYLTQAANLSPQEWGEARIDAVVRMCAPQKANLPEVAAFLSVCQRYQLDPIMKEIWLAKGDGGKIMVMVERDGFLKVADRHPDYEGFRAGVVYAEDEFELNILPDDEVELTHRIGGIERGEIVGGYAVVYMRGRPPVVVVRKWSDYKHLHHKSNWKNYGDDMMETRCLTAALRRAVRITGVYAPQEFTDGEFDNELPEEQRTGGLADRERRIKAKVAEAETDDPNAGKGPERAKDDEWVGSAHGRGGEAIEDADYEIVGDDEPAEPEPDAPASKPVEKPEDPDPDEIGEPADAADVDAEMGELHGEYMLLVDDVFESMAVRMLWQEQKIGKTMTGDWTAADFRKAIKLIQAGHVDVETPRSSGDQESMPL